jgi:transcriptional regulator with XRE-family HTH domain
LEATCNHAAPTAPIPPTFEAVVQSLQRCGFFMDLKHRAAYDGGMNHPPPTQVFGPAINRFGDAMVHLDRYAFKGVARLAKDARVSASSVSRLLNGKMNPSFLMVARLTTAIERQLGLRIDPRDLISESGQFLTRYVCDLVGCSGCIPERAFDEYGDLKPAFTGVQPGNWVTSKYPSGYQPEKGGK